MKNKVDGLRFNGLDMKRLNGNMPEGHFEIVNISTDGGTNISVNFDTNQAPLFERRHINLMLAALEDAFYRLRPDLREQ